MSTESNAPIETTTVSHQTEQETNIQVSQTSGQVSQETPRQVSQTSGQVSQTPIETTTVSQTSKPTNERSVTTKMYYKIIPKNSKVVYNELRERTKFNFNNDEYRDWLFQQLKDRHATFYYGFLNNSPSQDVNKRVIGKEGCYLMKTTQMHNNLCIWHNTQTKQFEFWAFDRASLVYAMNAVRERIINLTNQ